MKLQITSQNRIGKKGFLIPEVMIAFSLATLLTLSAVSLSFSMHKLHDTEVKNLIEIKQSVSILDNFILNNTVSSSTSITINSYGNDTKNITAGSLNVLVSNYKKSWGRDSCSPRFTFDTANVYLYSQGIDIGVGNASTDIEVRNGYVYMTADSPTASAPDFYIVDTTNRDSFQVTSSLNTGPGLSAIEIAGHYAYVANAGTTNQLQIIDIDDRRNPTIVSRLKLPLPYASSTAPFASAIFFYEHTIYIGTQKWDGPELVIVDVSNPSLPHYLGGFETDTLINDIYVNNGFAYLATSDEGQMRVLDVRNPLSIVQYEYFSPSGWETQEGKSISFFEGNFSLGRTTGGFNILNNHEIFLFSTTSPLSTKYSHDIPGGVYGMIIRPEQIFIATRLSNREFQIWKPDFSQKIFDYPLGFLPHGFACDGKDFYFGTGDQKGIAMLTYQ